MFAETFLLFSFVMITLHNFLKQQNCDSHLARLMGEVIPDAMVKIRAAIDVQTGEYAGTENVSGDQQLALDVQCNDIIKAACRDSGLVHSFASEEEEAQVALQEDALFTVCTDPLDGSSLANVNFAVGTIVGVYPAGELKGRSAGEQIAACFAVYGPRTTLMLTVGDGTHAFTLAPDGNFYIEKERIKIQEEAKYFAPGNLRAAAERDEYLQLVNSWIKKKMTLRYSGGMVPDINHTFIKGSGIFCYPGFSEMPQGKLRLLFECAPMAQLVEQAGGLALDGAAQPILSQKIEAYAQPTQIFIGSKKTVEEACNKML
ncbi:fructose-bisphosphatase class I [Candidatus Peregrinibacteria bacterium CG11_big_fil_rev_8_21_14_0_20_46_8]|nr:MAG: fructose-bisphosphatase class I [Candidatus Peregrinibacteria bacterium CG11_big_fil_rev_8_21_14_0_20_46_8]